jgi:hypothetical protein
MPITNQGKDRQIGINRSKTGINRSKTGREVFLEVEQAACIISLVIHWSDSDNKTMPITNQGKDRQIGINESKTDRDHIARQPERP